MVAASGLGCCGGGGELIELAWQTAVEVCVRASERGAFWSGRGGPISGPGLFQGTAGVALGLLRLLDPDRVGSILLFEVERG